MSKKVLMRSSNAMIAGVCAGLAEYFDVDTTLMRIIAAIFFICNGFVALYSYLFRDDDYYAQG